MNPCKDQKEEVFHTESVLGRAKSTTLDKAHFITLTGTFIKLEPHVWGVSLVIKSSIHCQTTFWRKSPESAPALGDC